MRDVICDVVMQLPCWSCDMDNINLYNKILVENYKKKFRNEFTACLGELTPEGALIDIIHRICDASLLCGLGIVNDVTK